jgi:hypothetical protein
MMRLHLEWSNHLMGTRLLPLSDDSDNIYPGTLWEPLDRDNGQPEHNCLTLSISVSPAPSSFVYLNLQLMSAPRRWLKMD